MVYFASEIGPCISITVTVKCVEVNDILKCFVLFRFCFDTTQVK